MIIGVFYCIASSYTVPSFGDDGSFGKLPLLFSSDGDLLSRELLLNTIRQKSGSREYVSFEEFAFLQRN